MKKSARKKDPEINTTLYGIDLKKNGLLIILGIFIFMVTVKSVLSLAFYSPVITDEIIYDSDISYLSSGILYPQMGAQPPLYLVILTIADLLSADKHVTYHLMLVIGCFVSSTIIFPAYLILRKYASAMNAILGATAASTVIVLNYFTFTLMLENLYIPLFLVSVLAVIEAFETNRQGWQILAGTSVVALEMTKSIGQIIEMAFLVTLIVYLINNREGGIIRILKSKAAMILSFLLAFGAWHVFLSQANFINAVLGNKEILKVGGGYNTAGMTSGVLASLASPGQIVFALQLLLNHLDYLLMASFMMLALVIFLVITRARSSINLGTGLKIGEYYIFSAIVFSLIGVTVIVLSLITSKEGTFTAVGRYLEAVVPPVILLGLIYISNIRVSDARKQLTNFVFFSVIVLVFLLLTTNFENSLLTIKDVHNNPSIGYLYSLGGPFAISVFIALIVTLFLTAIYLSSVKKELISSLILLTIIFSILASIPSYIDSVNDSKLRMGNPIEQYLLKQSDGKTLLIIDKNMTPIQKTAATFVYVFWNHGSYRTLSLTDQNTIALLERGNVYVLSVNRLDMKPLVNDEIFVLYSP